MRRRALIPILLLSATVLLVVPTTSDAGLGSRATTLAEASTTGTVSECAPQTLMMTKTVRLPSKAIRARYAGPTVGELLDLEDEFESIHENIRAEVTSVSSQRRGSAFKSSVALTINPPVPCNLPAPVQWKLEFGVGASYGMRAKHRFDGFMADYDGNRQKTSYTGNYHSLEFRDKLGLRTRYKVCAKGLFGSQCWRRSTDSDGYGSIEASIAINDRIGPGTLRWYVDGKQVARFPYKLKGETV